MAYEYDHDCPFEAFITNLGKYNEGELVGEWVKFPTTSEELQKVFERIGIGSKDDFGNPYEEWFISDYDCYVDGLYEKLGEYENLDELNYLASKLDELDDHDYNHFQAAMQISDYTGSIKDVINLIDNLDKYEIYPRVESNADLGHYYIEELGMMEVPDYLADYIDYEAYGRDVAINEMGQFTDYGYVRDTQESFTEYYDGDRENIPDEYRVMDFKVSGEKERKTMNSQIFLGGTEQTTLKDLNAILGKETIDMYNTGQSKGSQESYNMNYQKLGKDLMTMDELAVMDGSKCIVQVRGVRPFLSDKYDLTQHPNYKLTADYDKRNYFDVVKFLNHNLILKADDEYEVIDMTK